MTYCQLDNRWKNTIFGNSTSTNKISTYGCYLCSLVSGLSDRGYDYDPNTFNDLLKSVNAWVGPFGDYIDSQNIDKYLPAIFTHFQKIDPYNDNPKIDQLVGENLIGVCRVNAKAIGGTGTHYLYLVGQQNGVALIYDPWRNVTEPITTTYGKFGNILGIDMFTVKVKSTLLDLPPTLVPPSPPQAAREPESPVTASQPSTAPITPEPTVDTSQPSIPTVWVVDTTTPIFQNGTASTVILPDSIVPEVKTPTNSNIFQKMLKWLLSILE